MDGPATPGPRSAYHRLGDVARLLRVAPSAIRYWQQEFHPHVHPSRTRSGQNVYSNRDVAVLGRIRQLVHDQGLSIRDAREVLRLELAERQGLPMIPDDACQAEMDFASPPPPPQSSVSLPAVQPALADALAQRDALARDLESARHALQALRQRHSRTSAMLSQAIRELAALVEDRSDSRPR